MPKIISAMQIMNYKPDPDGVCFGLAAMSAKAVIRKDAQSFALRITLIHNSSCAFLETITREKQIELHCFFDELSIYQGANNDPEFCKIFPELRQDIANLEWLTPNDELASYDLLKEEEKTPIALPKTKATFINNFTCNQLVIFVQKIAHFLNGEPFSLLISESVADHTTQLGFDGVRWLLTDHDEINIRENTKSNIQKLVLKLFEIEPYVYKEQKTLTINIVLSHFSQTNLDSFENHNFSIDLLTSNFDKNTLFELILNFQYANNNILLKKIINKIKQIDSTLELFVQALKFKDSYERSILFRAAINAQPEILNLLIEEIKNTYLSEITKVNLLTVKDAEGRSIFYYAVSARHINTAHTIAIAMHQMQFHAQLQEMIASQDLDGASTIHVATLDSHATLVKLLLDIIDSLNISEQQKFNLITAKTHNQVSALHLAANEGCFDIVKLLLSTIKQKKVFEKNKLDWITSSTLDGRNALNIAAQNGNSKIVNEILKTIFDMNLPKSKN